MARTRSGLVRTARRLFQTRAVVRPADGPVAAARVLAEGPAAWDGPGAVSVTETHLVFAAADRQRRTSLRTVEAAERAGAALWVRRRRSHDWLVRFEDEEGARRVEVALRRAVVERAGR